MACWKGNVNLALDLIQAGLDVNEAEVVGDLYISGFKFFIYHLVWLHFLALGS